MIKVEYPENVIEEMTIENFKKLILLEKEEDTTNTIFYHDFKLVVVGLNLSDRHKFPTYLNHYCGYLRVPKNFNINLYDFESETHCGWTGGNDDGPGFDCAHCNDIITSEEFRFKLTSFESFLYNFNMLNLDDLYELKIDRRGKSATFKSKEYVFWKLKNVVDEIMKSEEYEIYINSMKIVKFVEKYMDDKFEMRNMRKLIDLRKFLENRL